MSKRAYTRTQIVLHWLTFVLVALQFLLHDAISEAFERVEEGIAVTASGLVAGHIFGGFLVFVLVFVRLQQRAQHGVPDLPADEPAWQKLIARVTHFSLYALLILMPVSGAVAWFRASEAAAEVHEFLRIFLLALILLHFGAALYHQFVLKNGLMDRMRLRSSPDQVT